jgi:hypothetical protein
MNDDSLLHAVLSGVYDPIAPTSDRPCIFLMADAVRMMKPQGWDSGRTNKALWQLVENGRARSCQVSGWGGNVYAYGLTVG